ncbi:dipeptide/oligopeptide/nickel ABC transporter ATP-binding protein [Kitasatospora phosalacinea]|uniref:Dipeptide/oligopeptide/nickel ABC transporter ATP-binding protein n=1 Tax=Kitasatospora phosalacinea TaxID=2065 RepID=A0A9W6V683_9ACTN|nr:ABC transporter ATP-binding protein [Kitasatospora phosalacinea]GLW73895.1 dipeptide/oligopeptide/nickel ABC transporter ATP-binding protein [Kitasatospora phosalacinea]
MTDPTPHHDGAATAGARPAEVAIRDLTVVYRTEHGDLPAVSHASLELRAGEITGLVGESGSGKSTLALSLLNAVPAPGRITSGSVEVAGVGDVTRLTGRRLRRARGGALGYVFQASQNSLNPLKTVGKQLLDLGRSHEVEDLRALVRRARELCERMGLDADRVLDSYQHELSGGMRQRVGIVLALVLNAEVLVLDEPTTALDMISQAAVLDIVRSVHRENGLATLVVTHDMGVVSEIADRLAVMYGGRIVEHGPAGELLRRPSHPYTRALIGATARIVGDTRLARALPGQPPDLTTLARRGCVFRDRCPLAMPVCEESDPALSEWTPGRFRACHADPVGRAPAPAAVPAPRAQDDPTGGRP